MRFVKCGRRWINLEHVTEVMQRNSAAGDHDVVVCFDRPGEMGGDYVRLPEEEAQPLLAVLEAEAIGGPIYDFDWLHYLQPSTLRRMCVDLQDQFPDEAPDDVNAAYAAIKQAGIEKVGEVFLA